MNLRLLLGCLALSTVASLANASTYTIMFERNTDAEGGQELAFLTYSSFDNLLGNLGGITTFSPINVAGNFSSTGLMFDGTCYTLMFERDTDSGAGTELAFLTYSSFDNLLTHTGAITTFSPINVAGNFSSTGLMFGGSVRPPPHPEPAVIPLPASVWMLFGALGLLGMSRRPRRHVPPAA